MKTYLRLISYLRNYRKELSLAIIAMSCLALTSGFSLSMIVPTLNMFFYQSAGITPNAPKILSNDVGKTEGYIGSLLTKGLERAAIIKWKIYRWIFLQDRFNVMRRLVFVILLLFALKGVSNYLQGYFIALVEQGIIRDLRDDMYRNLHNLSISYFHQRKSGQIISRFVNDVGLVKGAITEGLASILRETLLVIVYLAIILILSWKLALLSIVAILVYGGIVSGLAKKLRKRSRVVQEKMADISSDLQETLTGIRVVKAFSMEKKEIEKFTNRTKEYFRAVVRFESLGLIGPPLVELIGVIIAVPVLLLYGGHEIFVAKTLSPARLILFVSASLALFQPIKQLARVNSILQQGVAAAERIFRILDAKPDVVEIPDAKKIETIKQGIKFREVYFAYVKGKNVLENINMNVKVGEVIALVGPSGSGKSTLVDLILRFYEPISGYIEIDGIDIMRLKLSSLRDLIGIVTQETILFNTTVRENIAYGREGASQQEIEKAAEVANAHNFILNLPQQYNTIVGERGVKLSGGEKQRIAIARAILKNPPLLILDEATSALDSESEMLVQEAIDRLLRNRTTIVIAHRLSTVQHADRIVVLDRGRIVEEGKHEELLEREGSLYRKLYEMQFFGVKTGAA